MENIGINSSYTKSTPSSRDLNLFVDLIPVVRNYNKCKMELDLENDGIVGSILSLKIEDPSQCPKIPQNTWKRSFNDCVADSVYVFFRTRAQIR